jgi:hypothetical protein
MERYLFSNLAQCAITTTSFELYMSKTSVTKKEGAQSDQTPWQDTDPSRSSDF